MKKFNSIFKSIGELFDDVDELFNNFGSDGSTYASTVIEHYENGELVSHKEKVVKDGKVIKDVESQKSIGADQKRGSEENNALKKKLEAIKTFI